MDLAKWATLGTVLLLSAPGVSAAAAPDLVSAAGGDSSQAGAVPLPPAGYPAQTPAAPQDDRGLEEKKKESEKEKKEGEKNGDEKKDDEKKDEKKEEFKTENFNVYGQATVVTQWNGPFRSPYEGTNSFLSQRDTATSETSTLFLGARFWQGCEVYFNPEIAGGTGLSDVYGIAAFPNGEITRVGLPQPTPYVARLWIQQTFGFGGAQEKLESGPNQLAEYKDISRLTVAAGRMAATDWFDNNAYSHDPRSQFMNWCLMYNGAWDYPADVRGYTYGIVAELNQKDWALRYGIFAEPEVANGAEIDPKIGMAHGQAVELENRYKLGNHPGKIRWMAYWNRADMGNYDQALAISPHDPDVTATASYGSIKYGFGINVEQEFTDKLGGFLRLGWNDGHTETWAFTECDQTVAFGFILTGAAGRRDGDEIGSGFCVDGLSRPHREYLGAGGLGFELGDGQLNYEPELAWETYYKWQVFGKVLKNKSIWISPDFQFIGNPGYNGDRGPVAIGSVRVHAEF